MVRLPSRAAVTAPFSSKAAFIDFIKSPEAPEGHVGMGRGSRWSNRDLDPTPPSERTWTWYNLPLFWLSGSFSVTGWNIASSLIAVGLTWKQAFASSVLGSGIAGLVVVCMARPGAKYHIGYPVLNRAVMGMYGSYFFIFIRAVICIIWYGIQSYYGGNLLSIMFRCIFGDAWSNWTNTIPASSHVTSQQLLGFFIVWLLEFPFTWVHPTKIHYLFTIKGILMPAAAFGLFGWCMQYGAGISSIDKSSAAVTAAASKTQLGWSIMAGINVVMGGLSPMVINQPDLARYTKVPRDAGWPQGICSFFSQIIVFFIGLAATTSIQGVWGTAYWNVWDLLNAILDHYWTPASRAGVFFVAICFLFGVFATNFGANSIPFGADMTALFPKFLTIRRGQIACAILGICVLPWELIASAKSFLSFLGSYNIFMAPLCAVIMVDYYLARRGNIHVPSLYNGSKKGMYWFTSGINLLGVFAWIGGTVMGLPGLVGQYQPQMVSQAALNMYKLGWVLTFVTAAFIYAVAVTLVKPRIFPAGHEDTPFTMEWLANEGREGFYSGERQEAEIEGQIISSSPSIGDDEKSSGKDDNKSARVAEVKV
ncbi:Allantoin permease [Cytospora mali]|uniref:Allantoin permease n=1 Tax=Cytospora mali TaxID=578113 RepID=A0A194VNE7_CYTMA|nr:Allantoin permease [Valsa mali]